MPSVAICLAVVHQYIRDWLVVFFVLPLILNVRVRLSERMKDVLSCSMGVYLVHPLFCAGIGVVIRRIFEKPYGVVPIAIDWVSTCVLSLIVTAYLRKSKLLNQVGRERL